MGKYFLGSVGIAEAYRTVNNKKVLAFAARTLTENSINLNFVSDIIRAGTNAQAIAQFTHDPTLEIRLQDVTWSSGYVETVLGSQFTNGGAEGVKDYQTEQVVSSGPDTWTYLSHTPVSFPFEIYNPDPRSLLTVTLSFPLGGRGRSILIGRVDSDEWTWYHGPMHDNGLRLPAGRWNVFYMATDEQAREIIVTSQMVPSEVSLVITTPLYSGADCSKDGSMGVPIGHLTSEIPRFQLASELNLAFNMSSIVAMDIRGKALVCDSCTCDQQRLMRIVEVRDDYDFADDVDSITFVGN